MVTTGRKRLSWLASSVLVGLTCGGLSCSQADDSGPSAPNPLVFPDHIDLGVAPIGTTVAVGITLTNPCSRPIAVGNFRPDCTCTEIYTKTEQTKRRIGDRLVLAPHETRSVFADLKISDQAGVPQASGLQFRVFHGGESDGSLQILSTPVARLYSMPALIVLGRIPDGQPVVRRLELRSDGTMNPATPTLNPSPGLIARFTPPDDSARQRLSTEFPGQTLIGYVDLTMTPRAETSTGEIRQQLQVDLGRDQSCRVDITGEVEPPLLVNPSRLTLPRIVQGEARYEAKLIVRSAGDEAFQLRSSAATGPWSWVVQERPDDRQLAVLDVRYVGAAPTTEALREELIIEATRAGGQHFLRIPVTILPPSP